MWYISNNSEGLAMLADIPVWGYAKLRRRLSKYLANPRYHIGHYFGMPVDKNIRIYALLLDDQAGEVLISSCDATKSMDSLGGELPQIVPFEREMAERWGLKFKDLPWDKPLRFPHDREDKESTIKNYPFFTIEGDALHEVNVGPIHAGIIEPGVFRFICNGERILHLEIVLGFQHRGIENLFETTDDGLRQVLLAESIAGDSVIGHTICHSMIMERSGRDMAIERRNRLEIERAIALELERVAMHIADTSALCADIGYQLGQVACEALRTVVINTTQLWCGNRFGKGLIRPCGTNYPLPEEVAEIMIHNIKDVSKRYGAIIDDLKKSSSVLTRFEVCGILEQTEAKALGLVGVAGKASNQRKDIRKTHPWGVFVETIEHEPIVRTQGDVMARLMVRAKEALQSANYIVELAERHIDMKIVEIPRPNYRKKALPESLSFAFVEGWRGEICHVGISDAKGRLARYAVKDPSMHNWMGLAIAVRDAGISDFPICNKSFSLSFCGHDL